MFSDALQILRNEKQQVVKVFAVFCVAIFVLLFGWNMIVASDVFQSFNFIYNSFTSKIVIAIGQVSGHEIQFQTASNVLSTSAHIWPLIMPVEGYLFIFLSFIALLLVPIKQWVSSLSAIIFVLLFVAIRAAFISYIMLIYTSNVLLALLDPLLFIPMLVLVLFVFRNNRLINDSYSYLEVRFSEILNVSLSKLLFLLIIIPPLPRVLFTFIHSEIMPGIVAFILYFSKLFLALMGRTAVISDKYIFLDNNWINLEYPCLGLGVFTLISILIVAVKAKLNYKILYITVFAFIYSMLNSLRLSVLLLYINLTYADKGLDEKLLHDVATYFMYIVAFAGFWLYWSTVERVVDKHE